MSLLEKFVSVVAPHSCIVCEREPLLLCNECREVVLPRLPDRCFRCHALRVDSKVCRSCRSSTAVSHMWVGTEYVSHSKALVRSLKYERAQAAAKVMAIVISEALPYLDEAVVVTAIPTASSRVRQRGYNHARLIAKELADIRGLHYADTLHRMGQTRQVGATRKQRFAQLQGMFRPRNEYLLQEATILLVDDVLTTGASMQEAAKTLRFAGAKHVYGVVFAQKK